jgi:hypothetical protein
VRQSITGEYGKGVASRALIDRFARIDAHLRESDNESFVGTRFRTMKNGLYSIHVSLQDGRVGKGSGVVVFRDGKIFGGDAYLFYTGTYTVKDDTFRGEVLVQRHTSSSDANPLFGGPVPVGIGITGTFTDTRGVMNGTALVGKSSQIFGATLRKLADLD